jgi:hypothetical protein
VLVASSTILAREAAAPGRVVNALLAQGRSACASGIARGAAPAAKGVPFVSATWLCARDTPRLVGRAPLGGVVFTAEAATVSDDLRRIELEQAKLALPAGERSIRIRVDSLVLRGLSPWARASSLPPFLRALVVVASALATASGAAVAILKPRRRRVGGVAAAAIGASGPLAALAALHALELRVPDAVPGAWLLLFALVPVVAFLTVLAVAAAVTALPEGRSADSK